ncbi:Hypothetical Protein NG00_00503 [Corynebacterium camporealensis]|uniref:Uncharacterized protein n=1 Tax=Corynebacterium camporealensis TaxID=161896 RepID=A0A0F6QX84_9CORY|nr:hypothetical protein [Corynebacterium camporealensis]AKE38533.1 hypothetical protein UL81_02760 [Corynebacterium camporealensis]AVH87831.1 Hypothetical Protein NG00_00503 [Corynebacterium camporealensis]
MKRDEYVTNDLGFFKPKAFRLWSTIGILCLSVVAFLPMSFNTLVGETVLVNYLLVVIMLVSLAVLIIDLKPDRQERGGRDNV